MSVLVIDNVADDGLDYLRQNITELRVCSGDPADRAAAVTNTLAVATGLTSGSFSATANGDTSGRKITKTAESGLSISATGTAAVVCLCSATTLIWKVDLSATQGLTSGGTVDVAAFDHEIADAT